MTPRPAQSAFSLVELSIVLVILGLLTGGILAGQSLIRAAELRAVGTEYSRYVTATQTFRDKYFALPGDMTNATAFWGSATCPATAGTGTQTCNGNGNGELDSAVVAAVYAENFTYWQHLANAGLIEGTYTGMAGPVSEQHSIGSTNVPPSKLNAGLWFVAYDSGSVAAMFPVALPRNNFRLGGATPHSHPGNTLMKPEEQWNIDTKIDDGRPGTGAVTSPMASWIGNCANSSDPATADYVLSHSGVSCLLYAALTK